MRQRISLEATDMKLKLKLRMSTCGVPRGSGGAEPTGPSGMVMDVTISPVTAEAMAATTSENRILTLHRRRLSTVKAYKDRKMRGDVSVGEDKAAAESQIEEPISTTPRPSPCQYCSHCDGSRCQESASTRVPLQEFSRYCRGGPRSARCRCAAAGAPGNYHVCSPGIHGSQQAFGSHARPRVRFCRIGPSP